MKRIFTLLLLATAMTAAQAQNVEFYFEDGTETPLSNHVVVKQQIEALLTEINKAAVENRDLNLSRITIMDEASRMGLTRRWKQVHFSVDDDIITTPLLKCATGFQVRNIWITMIKNSGSGAYNEEPNRQLSIDINPQGRIVGVMPSLDNTVYMRLLQNEGKVVRDVAQRREILKFVEQFRNYYNEKDTANLRRIFSDDAIIITGTLVLEKGAKNDLKQNGKRKVKYKVQEREQYLNSLQRVFNNNPWIDVQFSDISIKAHGARKGYYGVTLKQDWRTTRYCDIGWVFLLWDFRDPEHPQIHVRTWQPDEAIDSKDDIFTENDFEIPADR